jgi:hypothetical protein
MGALMGALMGPLYSRGMQDGDEEEELEDGELARDAIDLDGYEDDEVEDGTIPADMLAELEHQRVCCLIACFVTLVTLLTSLIRLQHADTLLTDTGAPFHASSQVG